jgi:putative DNA primase/helicase
VSADQAKGTFGYDDPETYADDFGREISPAELAEMEKERKRQFLASRPIVRWAARQGLMLYQGAPGCKYPLKDFFEALPGERNWTFRPWKGTGTALALVQPDMAVLDGDTDEGRAEVAKMNLPPHFGIKSKKSGGEKRFFRIENPPKRMIRAYPGLDVLTNPHNKWVWCKVDDGGDDSGYEIITDSEDCPDLPDDVLADLVEAKSSGAVLRGSGTAVGRTREFAAGARWDDDDELLPTEHYIEHGIPYGLQEDRLYRLANRFAAKGLSLGEGTEKLLKIVSECEQDDRNPWTKEQLAEKMTRAIDWVATLPPRERKDANDEEAAGSGDRFLPHPGQPIKTARVLEATDFATEQGLPSLRWHRGGFTRWTGTCWPAEPDSMVEQRLILITEHAKYEEKDEDYDGEGEAPVRVRSWNPVPSSIAPLMKMLSVGVLQLPHQLEPPFWITAGEQERTLIPVGNGLLNARTRELSPHTPDFYNSWSLPYDFDPDAGEPKEWLKFLGQLWPDEPDSIDFLQELCGHLVSGETDQQKIPLLHGAPRGGKGTIVKVLTGLLGAMNVTTPTFANLMEPFGLEPLLGKPLAVISDMRVGGKGIQAAVERLLTISGGDMSTVHRKNKTALEVQLPTRFLLVSNELFALKDAATALVSRTIPLTFSRSWLGQEDLGLGARLTTPQELTSILNWCLVGLDRLHRQGRFTMPEGAEETLAELEGLASPVKAWARENCDLGPEFSDRLEALYGSFEAWAVKQRMTVIPDTAIFARNLRAAYPGIKVTRPRSGNDEKRPRVYTGIRARRETL